MLVTSPGSLAESPDRVHERLAEAGRLVAPGGFYHLASDRPDPALVEAARSLCQCLGIEDVPAPANPDRPILTLWRPDHDPGAPPGPTLSDS